MNLEKSDKEIFDVIECEKERQTDGLEMIASENYVSNAVLEAQGSILTNKYAEGYPDARYYGGCECVDKGEKLAIKRLKKLFGCNFANVQPHCGSSANMAAYFAVAEAGDKILGQSLDAGGHLTHGSKVSFSGKIFKAETYGLDSETGQLNYDQIMFISPPLPSACLASIVLSSSRFFTSPSLPLSTNRFKRISIGASSLIR